MKHTIKMATICVVLGIAAVGCQKEKINESMDIVNPGYEIRTMTVSIDGVNHIETLQDGRALHDFLFRILALSEEGHRVSFRYNNAKTTVLPTKKTVTYSTTDPADAEAWISNMLDQGYTVYIEYDEKTGTYHCTAIIDD